jgi:hypothetical protein
MIERTDDRITRIIQTHVGGHLRGYVGNFKFVAHVVQHDWLPVENEPTVQQHLATLRQHMANIGHPENDSFLLRLGLVVPGTQRGIVPPVMVLDANRGGFSARRQREAEGQILRLRAALEIGRRFVTTLSPDTKQAIAQLADFCQHQPSPGDAIWLNLCNELSSEEVNHIAENVLEWLDSTEDAVKDIGTELLQRLVCFRQSPANGGYCEGLIERGVFWPSSLYRDSGDVVARQLIARINHALALLPLNHLLLALAWTRSTAAQEAFREWSDRRPDWADKLHVPPEQYLHHAGWCLDDGQARDLISASCFRLVPGDEEALRSVRCRSRTDERCPSCGGPLGLLFDFSELGPEYFPGEFANAPRKVLTCLHCSCWGPVFTTYHANGTATWLTPIEPCEYAFSGEQSSCIRKIGDSPCSPFACAEAFALGDASTLGGIPMWLQDAEYPRCIRCARIMTFLAQHDNSYLREEGIYYAFFCASCHVAAVTYQQT